MNPEPMNILVLGAAGWVGRAVLANLDRDHHVRAFDRGPGAWEAWREIDGEWDAGEMVHGDIADAAAVEAAVAGMDAIVHAAVFFPDSDADADQAFLSNVKGLWNVLEAAGKHGVNRIVHIGSCQTEHPRGIFFSADVRRPDTGLYGVTKRLQEELCRTYHDTIGMRIIVLRSDYVVDSRIGLGRYKEKLGPEHGNPVFNGVVCRHDLAEACRLGIETDRIDFDIFHIVGTPEADAHCNVARSREVLGLAYRGDLEQYR